ncbi:MAG: prepilin-type N-terminal cleavage/methylation domain-containing protein [Burkholderiales bacterium]|nr:prepilin-type N-terminal cleavage/methylation domain-containing protein [Opitutaceae bacterium]
MPGPQPTTRLPRFRSDPLPNAGSARRRRFGFSLVEVLLASTVLMVGISGALVTLQRSIDSIAQARQLDAASQLMQTELERLRLLNWNQLQSLQDSGRTSVAVPPGGDFARFSCERRIRDLRDGMKEITLVASWGGLDGRAYNASLVTRYGRSGLNDYFYTTR